MEQTLKKTNNDNIVTKNIYSIRDNTIKSVSANKFPDDVNFGNVIQDLNE